jgi:hypothetical protein
MATPQTRLPFAHRSDPNWCASKLNHPARRRPTHTVTFFGQHEDGRRFQRSFRVCASCARPWESVRGAKVQKIQKGVA